MLPFRKQRSRRPDQQHIRTRFLLLTSICLLVIALPTVIIFDYYQNLMVDETLKEQGYSVLDSYASQTRESIEKGQRKSFQLAMDTIAQLDGVKYTALYNDDLMMNYRSGEKTVGIPFVFDAQGQLINPNIQLYEQTRGMYLRSDWNLVSRMGSPGGLAHRAAIGDQPCSKCHYVLPQTMNMDEQGRILIMEREEAHFFAMVAVETKCLVCHTYWQTGNVAGILAVTMDRGAFVQQAFESTRRLLYFLLFNALLVLAFTWLVATMYRRVLLTRQLLAEKSGRLETLLDNSGQGFLSFGDDLRIEQDYSHECENYCGTELAGEQISVLLYPDDKAAAEHFAANLQRVFNATDPFKQQILISLLPGRISLNQRQLDIGYRPLSDGQLMLIITDITDKCRLEEQVAQEQQRLKMVVAAVTETDELFQVLDDYQSLLDNPLPMTAVGVDSATALVELHRQIHTFKSLFGQLEFIHLPADLHQLESDLKALQEQPGDAADSVLPTLAEMLTATRHSLERDLTLLTDTLGTEFFARRGQLCLTSEQVAMLENLAESLLADPAAALDDPQLQATLANFSRLRYVPFGSLLAGHATTAIRLAEKQEKELAEVAIDDGQVEVLPEIYLPFCKSLIHLFRNAVDHGLEFPDERRTAGKPEAGQINCRVWQEPGAICLEIADDGRGLDAAAIAKRAVASGRLDAAATTAMTDAELWQLIFEDEFTTNEWVTEISGRGVGLAAVRAETERLGGRIEVTAVPGKGTSFTFRLPITSQQGGSVQVADPS